MSVPIIKQLTPDDRPWRIDWFGEIDYLLHLHRYSQPCVQVAISPLMIEVDNDHGLLSPSATCCSEQRQVWVPVGILPKVRIGDIWQRGQCVRQPDYQIESFANVKVERSDKTGNGTVNIIKSGLSVDAHFILPLNDHPWHRLQTQSYCVSVTLPGNRIIVIPCIELIRFYFGSSSMLLQRLFTGPLTPDALWKHKDFNSATGRLFLHLSEGMSGYSAADIGRIALDRNAWNSARMIHDTRAIASINSQPTFTYTSFPFVGETDLTIAGKWLSNSTFVAYSIRSCSHPFPFKTLEYETAITEKASHPNKSQNSTHPDKATAIIHAKGNAKSELDTADPGTTKSPKVLRSTAQSVRFPDLCSKPVRRVQFETQDTPETFLMSGSRIEKVSTGTGFGAINQGREIDLVEANATRSVATNSIKLPQFVYQGINFAKRQFRSDAKVTSELVVLPGYTHPVISLPKLVDEDGVINEIVLHGSNRLRQACFVQLNSSGTQVGTVFIVEGVKQSRYPQVLMIKESDLRVGLRELLASSRQRP